ncbi:hypothetical protein O0882_18625 [Janthinobacterium sp. SUN073]|uniref:hypothetical protein n=1 Tax=Janthinobacterium sp. SUN073 TaxID=3004102 RepID=UPI0025B26443|nr:hypothetical protein [Janthinobacterium sp. SUN073]MDN2698334.1 hypothetical protein [Janthinobacterium sp. SUN073]
MKNKKHWKNNGTKENPIYDFTYPTSWEEEEIFKENKKNIEKIKNKNIEWAKQLEHMPNNIMTALINEMENGNVLKSISKNNWPNNGSIVVSFRDKFHEENKKLKGIQWRELNDPHYCKEEIAEIFNKIEYLLIN